MNSFQFHPINRRLKPLVAPCCVALALAVPLRVAASVPEYVIPVRWCGVLEAPTMMDPDLSRPLRFRRASGGDPSSASGDPGVGDLGWQDSRGPVLSPDAVMKHRSGNPDIYEAFTNDGRVIAFQASIPSLHLERGRFAQSFPLISRANWNVHSGWEFGKAMKRECARAWQIGDELYYDADNNGVVGEGDYSLRPGRRLLDGPKLLKPRRGDKGELCLADVGASLEPLRPSQVSPGVMYGFIDENGDGEYSKWEPIYRYFDGSGSSDRLHRIDEGDILLFPVAGSGPVMPNDVIPGLDARNYMREHLGMSVLPLPEDSPIKFVDKFRSPPGEFSIGFGALKFNGIYAISTTDMESTPTRGAKCTEFGVGPVFQDYVGSPSIGQWFPSSGSARNFGERIDFDAFTEPDYRCPTQTIVVDDHAWMMENPQFEKLEGASIAHELAHALGIPHGDGFDNEVPRNGLIDDDQEDQCTTQSPEPPRRRKCETSNQLAGGSWSVPASNFDRLTCSVIYRDDGPAFGEANLMQDCWELGQGPDRKKYLRGPFFNHMATLSFSDLQFLAMAKHAERCGFGVSGPGETARSHNMTRWADQYGAVSALAETVSEQALPSCTVNSKDGSPIQAMPRSGTVIVSASGLTPGRDVEIDVNGRRVRSISGVKSSDQGTAVLELRGEQIPLTVPDDKGRPAVLSVGAGASTAICGFQFYRNAADLVSDRNGS